MAAVRFSAPPPNPRPAISASTEGTIKADSRRLWPLSRATLGAQRGSQQCWLDGIHSSSLQDPSWQGPRPSQRGWGRLLARLPVWSPPAEGAETHTFPPAEAHREEGEEAWLCGASEGASVGQAHLRGSRELWDRGLKPSLGYKTVLNRKWFKKF